jgi:hypothetical protein
LDDNFIDDEELELIQQDDDELIFGDGETSKFISGAPSEMPGDEDEDEEEKD